MALWIKAKFWGELIKKKWRVIIYERESVQVF
jgi:hypothetical protein